MYTILIYAGSCSQYLLSLLSALYSSCLMCVPYFKFVSPLLIPYQEELKRAQAAEREKRAAAAERRRAAAEAPSAQANSSTVAPSTVQPKSGVAGDINCSCCSVSLAGKVPFHRYNYKYCSTSCMHVHREILEDE